MIPRSRLREMFGPLHAEASSLAVTVFANRTSSHACAYLVRDCYYHATQPPPPGWPGTWTTDWHLPEPFVGDVEHNTPSVVFVGLNPSIDHTEPCPVVGCSLDAWLDFWLQGFDHSGRFRAAAQWIPLHEYLQTLLHRAVSPSARLGVDGLVTDVARYKAKTPHGNPGLAPTDKRRALEAALHHPLSLQLTLDLIVASGASIVVTVGGDATRVVGGAYSPDLEAASITKVNGSVFRSNGVVVIPSLHTNGRPTRLQRLAVAQAIARCLGSAIPQTW